MSQDSEDVVTKLLKRPKKDKGPQKSTYSRGYPKDLVHQADLLMVYPDRGFKYILVVVDVGTRLFDAVPLKGKTSANVLEGFQKIYTKNKILKTPKNLQTDKGTEFQDKVLDWFLKQGTTVRYGRTARHRQQALVEARNRFIGVQLYKRMQQESYITGQRNTEWVDYLPKVINDMNTKTKTLNKFLNKKKEVYPENIKRPVEVVLEQGTKVRPVLEQPIDNIDGTPLTGNFRAADIRFDPEVRTIVQVILQEGKPAMYVLNNPKNKQSAKVHRPGGGPNKGLVNNDIENVAYTRNQLQVVTDNETYGDIDDVVINKKKKKFDQLIAIAEKVVGEEKKKGVEYYIVKYRGYKIPEPQPKKEFMKNEFQRELVKEYLKRRR